jgi:hypothetical protein
MKRIIIAILGGIFLPVILTLLAATIAWLLPQYNLVTIYINGNPAPGLILAPVSIPIYIYDYLNLNYHPVFGTFWFRTIWFFGFDFVLYALLTYLAVSYFGLFQPKEKLKYSTEPPPPPKF